MASESQIKTISDNPLAFFKIANIVVTCQLVFEADTKMPHPLNLHALVELWNGTVHLNTKTFSNVVCNLKDPAITLLAFGKGQLLCTAATDEDSADVGFNYMLTKIREIYPHACIVNRMIHNVVAYGRFEVPVDIQKMCASHAKYSIFSPGSFPGGRIKFPELEFVYNNKRKQIATTVFDRGSFLLTGAPSIQHARLAFRTIAEKIIPFILREGEMPSQLYARKVQASRIAEEALLKRRKVEETEQINYLRDIQDRLGFTTEIAEINVAAKEEQPLYVAPAAPAIGVVAAAIPASADAMFTCTTCDNLCIAGNGKNLCCACAGCDSCRICKDTLLIMENVARN